MSAASTEYVRNVTRQVPESAQMHYQAYQSSEVRFMVKTLPHIHTLHAHPRWPGLKNLKELNQAEVCGKKAHKTMIK